jgi:hypothetical protein
MVMPRVEIFAMAAKKSTMKVGDWVRIRHSIWRGRIVEERGPLGPGGKLIFRVRIRRKPKSSFIELREDQLVADRPLRAPKLRPSALRPGNGKAGTLSKQMPIHSDGDK